MNQLVADPLIENMQLNLEQANCQTELVYDEHRIHDLHDSVVQSLYSLILLAEGWRRMAEAGQIEQADLWLAEIGAISRQTLCEMRVLGGMLAALLEAQ